MQKQSHSINRRSTSSSESLERTISVQPVHCTILNQCTRQKFGTSMRADLGRWPQANDCGKGAGSRVARETVAIQLDRNEWLQTVIWPKKGEIDSDGLPNWAMYMNGLGNALRRWLAWTGYMADLERGMSTKEQAIKSDTALPSLRFKAPSPCSDLIIGQIKYNSVKDIIRMAVRLLSTVSPWQLRRSDQQFNIFQFSNITSCAVSIHLTDGKTYIGHFRCSNWVSAFQ